MLYLDKKKSILIILIICHISCTNNKKIKLYNDASKKNISEKEFKLVYNSLNDSIKNWKKNNLFTYEYLVNNWKTDSLICFNKNIDRLVLALAYQNNFYPNSNSDHIINFYGAKFYNKWYFFSGASYILPREFYGSDINTPLSFEKLHEIALDEVYSGYLIKKDKGFLENIFQKPEYEINEAFFLRMESRNSNGAFGSCHGCKSFNEYVIYITNLQWKKPNKDGYIKYDHPSAEEMSR